MELYNSSVVTVFTLLQTKDVAVQYVSDNPNDLHYYMYHTQGEFDRVYLKFMTTRFTDEMCVYESQVQQHIKQNIARDGGL